MGSIYECVLCIAKQKRIDRHATANKAIPSNRLREVSMTAQTEQPILVHSWACGRKTMEVYAKIIKIQKPASTANNLLCFTAHTSLLLWCISSKSLSRSEAMPSASVALVTHFRAFPFLFSCTGRHIFNVIIVP